MSFQNVPTKSGGVVSGNISTGAGSPFGSGGKYEAQVRSIKEQIALKPEGFYDPPPNVLWKQENLVIRSEMEEHPQVKEAREILKNLYGAQKTPRLARYGSEGDKLAMQIKIDKQEKIISDHYARLLAEKNAPILQAQEEQKAQEAEFLRKMEIELWIQQALEKFVINQRPSPESTAPAITTISTERSWSKYAILGIGVVIFLIILRRRK